MVLLRGSRLLDGERKLTVTPLDGILTGGFLVVVVRVVIIAMKANYHCSIVGCFRRLRTVTIGSYSGQVREGKLVRLRVVLT